MNADSETPVPPELHGLPRHADPSRDLWPGIASQLDSRPHLLGWRPARGLAVAASLVIYAMGVATGHWLLRPTADLDAATSPATVDLRPAISVQRTGTAWVATLAQLARQPPGPARDQGREAAAAVLHSAALEWERLSAPDPVAVTLLSATAAARAMFERE